MTETSQTPGQEPSPRPDADGIVPPPPSEAHDTPAASAPLGVAPEAAPVLDEGTYGEIREPRSANRLALDGAWHQISPKYVASQTLQNVIFVVIVLIAATVLHLVAGQWWSWIAAGGVVVVTAIVQIILPRQARALGYMLREDDLVFRKGILWQRIVAVPYGRMQLVDITHGPMDRAFGIAKLKMITAAATTGVEIPGLSQGAAEALRDTLIEVAETRRTGL
jgi:membrane protein YdbS with pleckstrin-like domain